MAHKEKVAGKEENSADCDSTVANMIEGRGSYVSTHTPPH